MHSTRNLLFAFFLLFYVPARAGDFDYRVLIGEWAAYDSKMFGEPSYHYLRINEKYEGLFAYSYGKPTVTSFRFTQNDIRFIDGVAMITLRRTGWPDWRLVLSAFRDPDTKSGLATGTIYMFQENNGTPVLFNSPFIRLEPVEFNNALQAIPEIKKLRTK